MNLGMTLFGPKVSAGPWCTSRSSEEEDEQTLDIAFYSVQGFCFLI